VILQSKSHARCMARIMLHVASVVPDSHSNIRATCLPGRGVGCAWHTLACAVVAAVVHSSLSRRSLLTGSWTNINEMFVNMKIS